MTVFTTTIIHFFSSEIPQDSVHRIYADALSVFPEKWWEERCLAGKVTHLVPYPDTLCKPAGVRTIVGLS